MVANEMILSRKTMEGKISHDKILRSPEGFHLKRKKELFKSIPNNYGSTLSASYYITAN